jgi:hypothetical protein
MTLEIAGEGDHGNPALETRAGGLDSRKRGEEKATSKWQTIL